MHTKRPVKRSDSDELAPLLIDHPRCAANFSLLLDKIEGEIDGRRRVAGALDRARAILGEASG
ncbi:MAG: hypothetical protein KTR21_14465 [Rhodobacteraceae bacterium]|nr:hypothetical protein [Paracoccaceae bacterium]